MDLDDAAEELAGRLGVPVVILDEDMHLVTHSSQDADLDRAQLSIILTRRGTAGAINAIRALRVDRATGPVRLPPERDVPAHMALALRHSGTTFGYVTFQDLDPAALDDEMLAMLERASDEIGKLLALRRDDRRVAARRERQLLGMLVSSAPEDRAAAASAILNERLLPHAGDYAVAVVRGIGPNVPGTDRAALSDAVRSAARLSPIASLSGVIGDVGVIVLAHEPDQPLMERFEAAPQLAAVRIGVGEPCNRLEGAVRSYRQAELACRVVQRDSGYGRAARWRDLGWNGLLVQLPLDEITISELPPAVAELLTAPDRDHLIEAIECYLDTRGNAMETARRLRIHRSTLYYRLDQVRAATGSDLASSASLRELDLGLRVARLAGWLSGLDARPVDEPQTRSRRS